MSEILIVDDERSMREFLQVLFSEEGMNVTAAANMSAAIEELQRSTPDLVITDLKMKGGSGIELLEHVRHNFPGVEVIVITAFASNETAIKALNQGAYDYVTKPFEVDELKVVVHRALERQRLLAENLRMRAELKGGYDFGEIVGKSARMQEVYRLIEQVAPTPSNVLVTGESGTGKDLVAKALHLRSPRCDGPFVPIDCASIPAQLMEGELFGHVKGAFTGATANRKGLFELAGAGTVFLDEIAEIPPSIQVKLLRVVQERSVRRLGEARDRSVDVRLVAATNRDIEQEVKTGAFREDLFFRLNVIRIDLPPLRDRREDIPALVRHFIDTYSTAHKTPIVMRDALEVLADYGFPGNVRELENMVERALALSGDGPIGSEMFSEYMRSGRAAPAPNGIELPPEGADLEMILASVERKLLKEALRRSGGIKKEAAGLLGISFRSIRYRLQKHGLD